MFIYGADFFLYRPGLLLLGLGLALTLPMTFGPVAVGRVTFSLYWMLLGLMLSVLGLHGFYVGLLARILLDYRGERTGRWLRTFSYTRSVVLSVVAALIGAALAAPIVRQYLRYGLRLPGTAFPENHLAVTGLLFLVGGFMNFTFTLVLHAAAANVKHHR
jgi:hypothetical protein